MKFYCYNNEIINLSLVESFKIDCYPCRNNSGKEIIDYYITFTFAKHSVQWKMENKLEADQVFQYILNTINDSINFHHIV